MRDGTFSEIMYRIVVKDGRWLTGGNGALNCQRIIDAPLSRLLSISPNANHLSARQTKFIRRTDQLPNSPAQKCDPSSFSSSPSLPTYPTPAPPSPLSFPTHPEPSIMTESRLEGSLIAGDHRMTGEKRTKQSRGTSFAQLPAMTAD